MERTGREGKDLENSDFYHTRKNKEGNGTFRKQAFAEVLAPEVTEREIEDILSGVKNRMSTDRRKEERKEKRQTSLSVGNSSMQAYCNTTTIKYASHQKATETKHTVHKQNVQSITLTHKTMPKPPHRREREPMSR